MKRPNSGDKVNFSQYMGEKFHKNMFFLFPFFVHAFILLKRLCYMDKAVYSLFILTRTNRNQNFTILHKISLLSA